LPPDGSTPPLAGFTVAIASDRRRHTLATMLESVGAKTVSVQAFRTFAQPDEATLREATAACMEEPCHEVVISSGIGLRAWLAAAQRWAVADDLVARFAGARLLARDPAAADSLRNLGLDTIWSTAGATTEELLRYLLAQQLSGRRIVVQTENPTQHDVCVALRERGAQVVEVPVFSSVGPLRAEFPRRLGDLVTRQQVDAIVFLGEPAIEHLLRYARGADQINELLNGLRGDVLCAALSPTTGRLLHHLGVPPMSGPLPFVEELAEAILAALPGTALRIAASGRELEVRGHAAVLDGRFIAVQPGPLAVLRVLAHHSGNLVSTSDLRASVPGWATMDDHAMEMAVSRLRQALGDPGLVQTVLRRGYRLTL
jgi:uroporphyrinogen-III synthase